MSAPPCDVRVFGGQDGTEVKRVDVVSCGLGEGYVVEAHWCLDSDGSSPECRVYSREEGGAGDLVEVLFSPNSCCFTRYKRLRCVIFGASSLLEQIGFDSFAQTNLQEVSIPGRVRVICDNCFAGCKCLRRVTFGPSTQLTCIRKNAFSETVLDYRPSDGTFSAGRCF